MKDNNYGKKQHQQRQHRKVRICNGAGANRCSIKSKSPKVRIIRHSDQNTFTTICNVWPLPLNSKTATTTKAKRTVQPVTKISKLVISAAHHRKTFKLIPVVKKSTAMQQVATEKENQNMIQNEPAAIKHVSHDTSQVIPVNVENVDQMNKIAAPATPKSKISEAAAAPPPPPQRSFEPDYDNKPSFISQLLQGNLKCMELNLPVNTVKPKSPAAAAAAVMSQKSTTSAVSPPKKQPTYDKDAAREFMKKQQDQWKDKQQLEQRTKAEEKQLIKLRLKQLQETQKNLVNANIVKKRVTVHRRSSSPLQQQQQQQHQRNVTMGAKESPTICHKKPSSIALEKPTKTTKNVPHKSLETAKPLTPVKLSPDEPLKGVAGGLIRTMSSHLKDDLFSPLKLGNLTVQSPVFKHENKLEDISRPWNNTTQFGDTTLNLDGTASSRPSDITQKTSSASEKSFIELKSPICARRGSLETKSFTNDAWKESTNVWFNETHIKSTPYTFLTALNHKLGAVIKHSSTTPVNESKLKRTETEVQTEMEPAKIDVAIQEDFEEPFEPTAESKVLPPHINFFRPIVVVESASSSEVSKEQPVEQPLPLEKDLNVQMEEPKAEQSHPEKPSEDQDTTSEISSMKSDSVSSNIKVSEDRPQYSSNFEAPKISSSKDEELKKHLEKIRDIKRFDPLTTTSARSDDVVVRRRHGYVNVPQGVSSKREEEYKKLLSDFKSSLKNFIDLNKQLNEVKAKSASQSTTTTKDQKTATTSSQNRTKSNETTKTSKSDSKPLDIATSYSSSFDSNQSTTTSLAQTINNDVHPLNLNDLILDRSSIRSTSNASSTTSSPSKITFEGETVPTLSKTVSTDHHSKSENDKKLANIESHTKQLKKEEEEEEETTVTTASNKSLTLSGGVKLESKSSPKKFVDESIKEIDTYDEESSIDTDSNVSNLNVSYSTVGMIDQLIYNSVLKENHVLGVCETRSKSIIDRLKSQLSYLEIKKQKIKLLLKQKDENEKYNEELYSIRKKQRAIIIKLEQARKSLRVIVKLQSSGLLASDNNSTPSSRRNHLKKSIWNNAPKPNFNESIKSNHLKAISTPLKCFEMGSTSALEKLMTKREQQLLERRRKLDEFMQWQHKLDEEETQVMEMEKELVTQNLAHLKHEEEKAEMIEVKPEIETQEVEVAPQAIEAEPETSLKCLKGFELNALWHRLTGRKEEKYEPETVFALTKVELMKLYQEASEVVYTSDENYLKELCQHEEKEVTPYADTFSEDVESSPDKSKEEVVEQIVERIETPEVDEQVEEVKTLTPPPPVDEPVSESIGDDISDLPMSDVKSAPVETYTNGLPDIISEAEVLRIQQMQIEQEIEQLQRQVSFSIVDPKIPNKPPPPYTLPIEPVTDTFEFPAVPIITDLVAKRVLQLHTPRPSGSILSETVTANIYERLIIDMTEEFYFHVVAEAQPKDGGCGMKAFFHKFFSTTKEMKHLQEFIARKVVSICVPMVEKTQHGGRFMSVAKQRAAMKGKDVVDQLLLKEVVSEDPHWSCFDAEESTIKDELVCSIMKLLIDETVQDILEIL